ncbi:MAG: DUF4908 domain-containing protein [Caulobacteraceae bacterium]
MAPAYSAFDGKRLIAAALIAASLGGPWSAASAAPGWLRNAFGESGGDGRGLEAPPVACYRIDEGGVVVLDRSQKHPLMKFENSSEIWALTADRAPRGDIIYRNDLGRPVLRATRLGGLTVFTRRRPEGAAAWLAGACSPLRLAPLGPLALYQRLFQASVHSSRIAQHLIGFDAPDAGPPSDALIADAALVVVSALSTVASLPRGKALLAKIGKIAFLEGRRAGVSLSGGVVTITVAPSQGVAGRPSSGRILEALGFR